MNIISTTCSKYVDIISTIFSKLRYNILNINCDRLTGYVMPVYTSYLVEIVTLKIGHIFSFFNIRYVYKTISFYVRYMFNFFNTGPIYVTPESICK